MYKYPRSVLASTNPDAHGERFSREQLERIVTTYPNRMPINLEHNLGMRSVAYAENLRLEQDGEVWKVVADISSERPLNSTPGLSISATSILHDPPDATVVCYLPYPAYSDDALVDLLVKEGDVTVGRLQRKGLTEVQIGLLVTVAALIVSPEWAIQYETRIRPQIIRALSLLRQKLAPQKLGSDICLSIEHSGGSTDLLLIADRLRSASGQRIDLIDQAVEDTIAFIRTHERKNIRRLRVLFYPDRGRYEIINVEYTDGSDVNIVP